MRVRLPRCRALPIGKNREVSRDTESNVFPVPGYRANTVADACDFV
jgi:hypothetical protein